MSGADQPRQEILAALKLAAESVGFDCGLEVLAPLQIETESRSFEQQRLQTLQQKVAQIESDSHLS